MNYIKSLYIKGFKKFMEITINFNEHMNILVGENETGKSTILEAIKIVLSQHYRNADKSVLKDLFNVDMVSAFHGAPDIKTLPYIIIELKLALDPTAPQASLFYGEAYGEKKPQQEEYGIHFECKFDEELGEGLEQSISEGKIPYEYYSLSWTTFANRQYQSIKKPLQFVFIDAMSNMASLSFNAFNRNLFESKYKKEVRIRAKNDFREKIEAAFETTALPPISENRRFGVDSKKVVLETILSVFEDSIALENRGSGMESLIKTQIAIDRSNGLDVILMEEPENHLCFSTLRQMLSEIESKQNDSQIIVTTHNNMIASKLNLRNILWITDSGVRSLNQVDQELASFFVKADNNSFLQLLLSPKVILVEGATECILLPSFYKQITGRSIETDGISIISCNGISYKRYLSIAEKTAKRIAVITDNDEDQERINEANRFNQSNAMHHIFMGYTVEDWTWESCVYRVNKAKLTKLISVRAGAKYTYKNKTWEPVLGKMLNEKADTAYTMLTSNEEFTVPQYIEDAIKWINE